VVVFGIVVAVAKVPLKAFTRAVREPFTIAFTTANSEAALPKAFDNMEKLGVPRGIVGFVLPAGYTFNLDGSTLHLAVASVFIAQVAESTTGNSFQSRPADHHDADAHDYIQGRGGGAAGFDGRVRLRRCNRSACRSKARR